LTVPSMQLKVDMQVAGLGFGFMPEPTARTAIRRGMLVEKQVEEMRLSETFYLAWRIGEEGAALRWWIARMQQPGVLERLVWTMP
jgi:DNA-binding transcriptional LysR family regulator